jgi:CHAT domain-containing protein
MSYNAFWKPIEAELGEYKKLYIATDGVYSQLNLETLADAKGNYVIDNYDITLLTTLRELTTAEMPKKVVKKSKKSPDKPFTGTAILVGNPSYYTQKQGNEIDPLPGAEKEVENIAQMLNRNNWDTRLLTASAATEEEVRKVSNPTVFHIATHGFFVENHTEQEQGGLRQSQEEENPMLRAGLLLAGGGDAYEYKKSTFFLEEGVLTAYEAMNLSLDQTELVVLSACETGLGKLQVGEGVYGLQRSLMIAGAKNIVMSLFKVPDTPTRELMTTFYQEWLKDGNKRAAFLKAKKIMRQKYEHPYYWGSFVMLGM